MELNIRNILSKFYFKIIKLLRNIYIKIMHICCMKKNKGKKHYLYFPIYLNSWFFIVVGKKLLG